MICASCRSELQNDSRSCPACGTAFGMVCGRCGAGNAASARFCGECGQKLGMGPAPTTANIASAGAIPSTISHTPIERRQLSVMFCDVVSSTRLVHELDPEDLREVIGEYQRCVTNVVGEFDGVVASYMGDGTLVFFGYPLAHEDDPERAIRAGLQILDAMQRLPLVGDTRLQLRIGIATGIVVVGDSPAPRPVSELVGVGETLNLAARLQEFAESGALIISDMTHRLAGGLFEYRDLGSVALKGFAEPVRVWRVLRARGLESRFEAQHESNLLPLVGREEEFGLLCRRWQQVCQIGGRAVVIRGEPGIGKSRLRRAIQEHVAGDTRIRWRFYCSEHHSNSAFYPIIRQAEGAAKFTRDDSTAMKWDRLKALMAGAGGPEDIALMGVLLSLPEDERFPLPKLSSEQRKERTMTTILSAMANLSREAPMLIVFEDVQWIDPTTLELLALMVERVVSLRVLLVITARPQFTPPWPSHSHVTTLSLSRMSRDDAACIAERTACGKQLPNETIREILSRADGVPLFIEELTKAVLEGDQLRPGSAPTQIPNTLYGSLMARLDRLGNARAVAQIGAVIGLEFSQELLGAVAELPGSLLDELLERLVRSDLVGHRGTPLDTFFFRHALIREAAYGTLLRGQRQALHARIARTLEQRFPEELEQRPELLGYHCAEGGLIEKAIGYWGKAGRKSAARYAKVEAVVQLRRALELLNRLPESADRLRLELELQSALGRALIVSRGSGDDETGQTILRARELSQQLNDTPMLVRVLGGLAMHHLTRGEHRKGCQVAEELLSIGDKTQAGDASIAGHLFMGIGLIWQGLFPDAQKSLERVLGFPAPQGRSSGAELATWDMRIFAMCYSSIGLFVLGYPDQAVSRMWQALAHCRELRPPHVLMRGLAFAALINLLLGNDRLAIQHADEAIALSAAERFPFWDETVRLIRGVVLAARDEPIEGLALARKAVADLAAPGPFGNRACFFALLARACEHAGRTDEALQLLDAALQGSDRNGERWFDAEVHRRRGVWFVNYRPREQDQIETCFYRALALAREQRAKLWELRAATALARFWAGQGKAGKAIELLAPVHASFSEGFDTLDLKAASSLLNSFRSSLPDMSASLLDSVE